MLRAFLLLLLLNLSLPANAETIAATGGFRYSWGSYACSGGSQTTKQAACSGTLTDGNGVVRSCVWQTSGAGWCSVPGVGELFPQGAYVCPSTGGWTLSGSNCVRPDCPANTTRDETTGQCTSVCETRAQSAPTYQWYVSAVGGPSVEGSYCSDGCTVALNPAPTGTSYNNGKDKIQRYEQVTLGIACTNGTPLPATNAVPENTPKPPEPPKRPPCDATEGVLTSTSGTIACVPPGTPSAQTPQVRKESKTDRFPDSSTKTTETTYTKDPVSQVQDTYQKITTTGPPGNPTGPGQAGPPGVTNSAGSSSAGTPDNRAPSTGVCKDNPELQICKGGISEEATQKKVLAQLEKMGNPGDTPYDAVTNAKETDTAKQANDTQNTKFSDAAMGVVDPVASQKDLWETAMSSGWFSPIPPSGCTPFSGTVGGRSFTIDHCPTASKVSVILEYAMWFMVVVGVFVMFTGGRAQGA